MKMLAVSKFRKSRGNDRFSYRFKHKNMQVLTNKTDIAKFIKMNFDLGPSYNSRTQHC